jgi:Cu-processing system permease protein
VGFFAAILLLAHRFHRSDGWLVVAIYFIMLQFIIITALALLFSCYSSPLLSAIFSFALFVIGTFAEDLRAFAAASTGFTHLVATAIAWLVPNFAALNVISRVAHDQPLSGSLVFYNTAYALLYSTAALAGAVMIFERRDLK